MLKPNTPRMVGVHLPEELDRRLDLEVQRRMDEGRPRVEQSAAVVLRDALVEYLNRKELM